MPTQREDVQEFKLDNEPGDTTDYSEVTTKKRKGVYVPLNEDGTINFKRFKPEQQSLFNDAIQRSPGESLAPSISVDRESVVILYDGVAMALQQVGKMFFKWPADFTSQLQYSKSQKERLAEPTAKVIEKYAPEWLLKHQELVALFMVFTAVTKEMVDNAAHNYALIHPPQEVRVHVDAQEEGQTVGNA